MTLGLRKLVVLVLVGGVFLLANIMIVAHWLQRSGLIEGAAAIRRDFLTGTAITVIIVLLILLVKPRGDGASWLRRCPVCDHRLLGGKYCGECGSKVNS
jgi:hypothetical protein